MLHDDDQGQDLPRLFREAATKGRRTSSCRGTTPDLEGLRNQGKDDFWHIDRYMNECEGPVGDVWGGGCW